MRYRIRHALLGLALGVIAQFLVPGRHTGGFYMTCGLAVAGACLAGFAGERLGLYQEDKLAGLYMSALGSIAALLAYSVVLHGG